MYDFKVNLIDTDTNEIFWTTDPLTEAEGRAYIEACDRHPRPRTRLQLVGPDGVVDL